MKKFFKFETEAEYLAAKPTLPAGYVAWVLDSDKVYYGESGGVATLLIETTYASLKAKRDNGELTPGCLYRITDFVTTTSTSDTQSAGHAFDLIVTALSDSKLSEDNVYALQHEGDTYFSSSKLEAWELKYCLDNDGSRYEWADTTNGKGVIYYMKDEHNNECPYDFKNIMFRVGYISKSGTMAGVFYYTFSIAAGINGSNVTDHSLNGQYCYGNRINKRGKKLNFIVFRDISFSAICYGNTFGDNCYDNTFGNNCTYNTFGKGCYGNTFGNNCTYNTFGDDCYGNTFGNNCTYNTFGKGCYTNSFFNDCHVNTFGNNCAFNTFGDDCYYNTFGNNCNSKIFSMEGAKIENIDQIFQVKDDKLYPVSHPDLSTQPSILPQRFGNMDIKEVLIPIETPATAQTIDIESLPLNVMPVTSSVFCNILQSNATLKKGSDAWELCALSDSESSWDSADWWLLVQYVEQDNGFYYGPQYDEIDDTDDGQPVDLGLPSGTKWMKSNIGATKPSDFGKFFQWGDTQGYSGVDEHQFSWNDYKWGTSGNLTKYNNTDGKTTLDNDDDPVYTALGDQYKTPSEEQLQELITYTDHQWVRLANGVNGMKFVNKSDDTKYIFIPAAGLCSSGSHDDVGSWGYVWSASRHESNADYAWGMDFYAGDVGMGLNGRCLGFSVRAVVAKNI